MNKENLKIGIYTENEIFKYMTEQEGGILGRSMYDAVFNKIHNLITENQQLKEQLEASERARKEAIELIKELYDNTDDTTCYDIDKDEKEILLKILDIDKGE